MLEAVNIKKKYDNIVLNDISFSIPDKSIVLLNGDNGMGKTTLLYILGGLIEFEGDVIYSGFSIRKNFEHYIGRVSVIPNTPYIFEHLTVNEMIDLVISLSEKNKQLSQNELKNELIEKLNLYKYKNTLAKNLSLGTRQKVSFICSFINSPSIILIDEPFVNFDSKSLDTITSFLYEYVLKNNSIVIFSSHANDNKINSIVTHKLTIQDSDKVVLSEFNDIQV